MSEERKSGSIWPWIVALLIGVPVLYVASFGPACWITSRTNVGADLVPVVYGPLTWAMSPQRDTAIMWYAKVGAAGNWTWAAFLETDETPGRNHTRWKWVKVFPGL